MRYVLDQASEEHFGVLGQTEDNGSNSANAETSGASSGWVTADGHSDRCKQTLYSCHNLS
jgi:hypothetical protein